jgi:hypothetical protein
VAEFVVIVEVFVAERSRKHAGRPKRRPSVRRNAGLWRRGNIPPSGPRDRSACRPRPTAGRPRRRSTPRHRNRPLQGALRRVQIRSVSRYAPSASGHFSESVEAILTKQLLTDSQARCTIRVVESRRGAAALRLGRRLRFPSPLIKPDVRISRIRLSDRLRRWLTAEVQDARV